MNIETAAQLLYGWSPEKTMKVMQPIRHLLAQIDVPINYAGVHWITIDVHGERGFAENGDPILLDMRCYRHGECIDNFLPESLKQQFAEQICMGDFD